MKPIRVMLVDDHGAFLRVATRFLQKHCAGEVTVVGSATDCEEALSLAQDLHPQVVLLDLWIPGLIGRNIIPRLRTILPEIGIVVLALFDARPYRPSVVAAGADDCIAKAALNTDLLPAIRHAAERLPQARPAATGGFVAETPPNTTTSFRPERLPKSQANSVRTTSEV